MIYLRRLKNTIIVLLMMNIPTLDCLLCRELSGDAPGRLPFAAQCLRFTILSVVVFAYLFIQVLPCYERGLSFRLQILFGGYELILSSIYALLVQIVGTIVRLVRQPPDWSDPSVLQTFLVGLLIAWFTLLLHYLNGFWRICICSAQLGMGLRILMFFFWWLMPVNLFLFVRWCTVVRRELYFEKHQYLLNLARVESAICQTRYPVVMIHGIFFRDWQFFNYWGRIPKALKINGAHIYYGCQQSSLSVADSAAELKAELLRILKESGADKVNIVAHSKGGLDSRYAISKLGMEDYVASLTTINTPHRGCKFVDRILNTFPDWIVRFAAARYNSIFRKLGDASPNFLAGIQDLTAASCARFNEEVPDSPKVYYQSSMSKMRSVHSAGFPLNLGYLLSKKQEGENDGLVSVSSARWGHFLGILTAGRKGISHGDMIDLTHKNIKGFDVSEFYVQLLAGLKEKGF